MRAVFAVFVDGVVSAYSSPGGWFLGAGGYRPILRTLRTGLRNRNVFAPPKMGTRSTEGSALALRSLFSSVLMLCGFLTPTSTADIYRWDTGKVIPGTNGVEPRPKEHFYRRNLRYANFAGGFDLRGTDFELCRIDNATFANANLIGANFEESTLTDASFAGANLSDARFFRSTLTNADLTVANLIDAAFVSATLTNVALDGAIIRGAGFTKATSRGFTREQLYSTASYQARDLRGIGLARNDLTGWEFSEQNLTNAEFSRSALRNVDLSGAIVTGAEFSNVTWRGFTKEQLYSTASYRAQDLQGVDLSENDLTGWDFSGFNLKRANLSSTLTNANLSGATITGAVFNGLTREQLYSTASYEGRDLQGVGLMGDFTGWNFSRQDLTDADFGYMDANLTNANLVNANLTDAALGGAILTNANLADAVVTGASLQNTTIHGFTKEQLYSTASYQAKNLQGIGLWGNDLTDWDFSGQDLTGANFGRRSAFVPPANLTNVDFSGANLKNANLDVPSLSDVIFDSKTTYNQWTIFSFDPVAAGLNFMESPIGDMDGNDILETADVDILTARFRNDNVTKLWLSDEMFDVNNDSKHDHHDITFWVHDLKSTYFGDANLDGEFNSEDLVAVFSAGEYEDEIGNNSGWRGGDWNGDGDFNSADLVVAFQDGGYEMGQRPAVVPEPASVMLLVTSFTAAGFVSTTRRNRKRI